MDARAIRRAALITLRRAILQNFPPGPEREKRLEWLASAVSSRQEAMRSAEALGPPLSGKPLSNPADLGEPGDEFYPPPRRTVF